MPVALNSWKSRLMPGTETLVDKWMVGAHVQVRLSSARRSKHGDFRHPRNGGPPVITLNHDLHPVEFMITFCHELAHYRIWRKYSRKVSPHGIEWKSEFRRLLMEFLESGILEPAVAKAVVRCYFRRESIGSGICQPLYEAIGKTGSPASVARVADVPEGAVFRLRTGRVFIKGPKLRTRYRCIEKGTGRSFTVHPMAEIIRMDDVRQADIL